MVYKAPHSELECKLTLHTRIYFKPTDTHQLLYGSSFHPKHTIKGILKSQILRLKRICTTYRDFKDACHELYAVLKHRGYSRSLYRDTVKFVLNHDFEAERERKKIMEAYKLYLRNASTSGP